MLTKTQVLALFLGAISAVELTNENAETNVEADNAEANTEPAENNTEANDTNANTETNAESNEDGDDTNAQTNEESNEADSNPENNTQANAETNTETNAEQNETNIEANETNDGYTLLAPYDLLNGPGTARYVPESQSLTPRISGTTCAGNSDCSEMDGEKCGNFQIAGSESVNLCVVDNFCKSLGRINNNAWSLQCWEDPTEDQAAAAPAIVDPETLLSELGGVITKNEPWHGVENLFVSSRFNHQDGWWILNEESKWVETDKPIDNRCFIDIQCPPQDGVERCCGTYPDTNNRRCMAKSLHAQSITVGPMTFTPTCPSMQTAPDQEPTNAGDDIAAGALAEAAEALDDYYYNVLEDAKDLHDYENMSDEERADFDTKQKDIKEQREGLITDLKAIIGYDHEDCDGHCQAAFEEQLLEWEKQKYLTCKEDPQGIACRQANEIKIDEETARAGGEDGQNYYKDMTDEERIQFQDQRRSHIKALESTLAAAWIEENQPSMGEDGSSCAELKCTNEYHCCGTSTPKEGKFVNEKLESVCVNKNTLLYTDSLGREFNHVCAATKMFVSAVAAATALYSLM